MVTSPPDPLSFPRRGGRDFLREALPLSYSPILLITLLERRTWEGAKSLSLTLRCCPLQFGGEGSWRGEKPLSLDTLPGWDKESVEEKGYLEGQSPLLDRSPSPG